MTKRERKQFGAWLRRQRIKTKMKQKDLAEQAEIDPAYLCNVERGACEPPRADKLARLAAALGVDPLVMAIRAQRPPAWMERKWYRDERTRLVDTEKKYKKSS